MVLSITMEEYRQVNNFSIEEVAKITGFNLDEVIAIENYGVINRTLTEVVAMCDLLPGFRKLYLKNARIQQIINKFKQMDCPLDSESWLIVLNEPVEE